MIALITTVAGRHDHLLLQQLGVRAGSVQPDLQVVVAMDDPDVAALCGPDVAVLDLPRRHDRLPVAAARNLGAAHATGAGADVLVFLDVDCVPSPGLVERYAAAAREPAAPAVLSGAVRYLPAAPPGGYRLDSLDELAEPHPARPELHAGTVAPMSHELFWSLSFALTVPAWTTIGGFCERYEGYGGEDTDFAEAARHAGVEHLGIGGAVAYHQWHPSPSPPLNHLDDIVRNAAIFHERWGWWPMRGWLDAFAALGVASYDEDADTWTRIVPGTRTKGTTGS